MYTALKAFVTKKVISMLNRLEADTVPEKIADVGQRQGQGRRIFCPAWGRRPTAAIDEIYTNVRTTVDIKVDFIGTARVVRTRLFFQRKSENVYVYMIMQYLCRDSCPMAGETRGGR